MAIELLKVFSEHFLDSLERFHTELVNRNSLRISSCVSCIEKCLQLDSLQSIPCYWEMRMNLWEELHIVHWRDTHSIAREIFGLVCGFLVCNLLIVDSGMDVASLCRIVDYGILLGSARNMTIMNLLIDFIQRNEKIANSDVISRINGKMVLLRSAQSKERMKKLCPFKSPKNKNLIPVEKCLDILTFNTKYFMQQRPVVLKGSMQDWTAMQQLQVDQLQQQQHQQTSMEQQQQQQGIIQQKYQKQQVSMFQRHAQCKGHQQQHQDDQNQNRSDHLLYTSSPNNRWANLNYLLYILGHRTVPVETGSTYLSDDSGSAFITGQEFIGKYILGTSTEYEGAGITHADHLPMGYLAQHQLFDQIPQLKTDVIVPDYCALLLDIDEEPMPIKKHQKIPLLHSKSSTTTSTFSYHMEEDTNYRDPDEAVMHAWLGPVGTVSPLHHDPYYNFLAQTAGYKYIRLYDYRCSCSLYPLEARLSNNSSIDLLEETDILREKYPHLETVPYVEYVLGPGEMVFIPRWWWHFIVAIDRDTALQWRQQHNISSMKDTFASTTATTTTTTTNATASILKAVPMDRRVRTPQNTSAIEEENSDIPASIQATTTSSGNNIEEDTIIDINSNSESMLRKRTRIECQSEKPANVCDSMDIVDYSFSVSFWWGKRMILHYS